MVLNKASSVSFEYFALDAVRDCVLLLEGNKIVYANVSFASFTKYEQSYLIGQETPFPFLGQDSGLLLDLIGSCNIGTHKTGEIRLQRHNYYESAMQVTISRYDDKRTCCIFKDLETNEDKIQRLNHFEVFDRHTDHLWTISEYDDKMDNVANVFMSRASYQYGLNTLAIPKDRILNTFMRGQAEVDQQNLLEIWLAKYREMIRDNKNHISSVEKRPSPTGDRYYQHDVYLTGRSQTGRYQIMNSIRDITSVKLMELELDQEKKRIEELKEMLLILKGFFDHSPVLMGIIEIDEDANEIIFGSCNPSVCKAYGMTSEQLKGHKASSIARLKDRIKFWIEKYLQAKTQKSPVIFESTTDFPSRKWYSNCVMHLVKNKYSFFSIDITERVYLEEELKRNQEHLEDLVKERTKELEKAVQVKSRFLAIMSHEIRTPLSGIMSTLSLLGDTPLNVEQQSLIRISQVCGEQLLVVINDILDTSKIDENKIVLETEPFSLKTLLEESLEVVLFDAEKKNLELLCDTPEILPGTVVGDPTRLRQIIINLLNNAVKFSSKGDIILQAEAKLVNEKDDIYEFQFSVSDNGIGIAEHAKKNIFLPFTQADTSTTRLHGGTGLGIYISRKLAELMGGRMWFDSIEGQGTTFYFTIQAKVEVDRPDVNPTYENHIPQEVIGKKILIVDHSQKSLSLLSSKLSSWGLHPITMDSLILPHTIVPQVDMILIDWKQSADTILTANTMKPTILMGYNKSASLGHLSFIKKPLRDSLLRSRIVNWFLNKEFFKETPRQTRSSSATLIPKPKSFYSDQILLAEDNHMNQKVIQKLLNVMGYINVDTVDNGRDAVTAVQRKKYDLVLMDCMMPHMNGIDATKKIRQEVSLDYQPIIVALTADAFSENRDRCIEAGMQDIVTKPISNNVLNAVLQRFLHVHFGEADND